MNHFPIGHQSFHYSRSSMLNSEVNYKRICAGKRKHTLVKWVAKSILLSPFIYHNSGCYHSSPFKERNVLVAIHDRSQDTSRPHSHGIAKHFPLGHPSFHYSSSSTLNSGVLNGYMPEKRYISSTLVPIFPTVGRSTPFDAANGFHLASLSAMTGLYPYVHRVKLYENYVWYTIACIQLSMRVTKKDKLVFLTRTTSSKIFILHCSNSTTSLLSSSRRFKPIRSRQWYFKPYVFFLTKGFPIKKDKHTSYDNEVMQF
ncbi:hypothetical protein YC2023_043829 [Brassica napus]